MQPMAVCCYATTMRAAARTHLRNIVCILISCSLWHDLQGEEGQYFYVVFEGQFDLNVNSGGVQITLHSYSAGDHANSAFGELALATGRPHAARIVARTDGMFLLPSLLCGSLGGAFTHAIAFLE